MNILSAFGVSALLIAGFYKMPELTAIFRVMSLIVNVSAVKKVHQAYVSRRMQFKKFFYATLCGTTRIYDSQCVRE